MSTTFDSSVSAQINAATVPLPGLLSYASLRTSSGTWYNLVLMNDDQVRQT